MSDKRSVSTDALETLGTRNIPEGSGRDAIHLAVEPVIAGEVIYPGQNVGMSNGVALGVASGVKMLGIADPFVGGQIAQGERFWLVVFPRKITSLRHVWAHPDFPEATATPDVSASELRLRDIARDVGVAYEDLLYHAEQYAEYDDYWIEGGRFEGVNVPSDFWDHYVAVTGKKAPVGGGGFFSCSC